MTRADSGQGRVGAYSIAVDKIISECLAPFSRYGVQHLEVTVDQSSNSMKPGIKSGAVRAATIVFWLIVTVLPVVGIVLSVMSPFDFYQTQAEYREFAAQFPTLGPVLFVGLQALQVVVAPLNHYSIGYMGGYLYGTYFGALLNWIGRVIGHVLVFWIFRVFGRRLADRFVSPKTLDKYDQIVAKRYIVLFFVYFLPLFPDDEISYLMGLSKMRFRWFLFANVLGHVSGSLALAYAGSGISTKDPLFWILTVVTLLGFPLLWILWGRGRGEARPGGATT